MHIHVYAWYIAFRQGVRIPDVSPADSQLELETRSGDSGLGLGLGRTRTDSDSAGTVLARARPVDHRVISVVRD